jgi:hypothetical protein
LLPGFRPDSAKAECEDELTVASGHIDFSGQRNVSVFRAVVLPGHLEILRQVLPAIRCAGKSDGTFRQRRGTGQGERAGIPLGKEHRCSLVITHPAGIARSEISQMWSQQCIQAVVAQISLERHEPNFLQYYISPRIGQHFLFDLKLARLGCVNQFVGRDSRFDGKILEGTMAFLLGEELTTVGDNEAEVAGARLVHAGKIDLIENAMAQRKPKSALHAQCSAYAGLGARSPAGFDSGPARRITKIIAQRVTVKQFARRCGFVPGFCR